MKNTKAIISILLVCALFFSLASCGKNTTDEATTTTTTEQYTITDVADNSDATYSDTVADTPIATNATVDSTTPVETQAQTQAQTQVQAQEQTQAQTQAQTQEPAVALTQAQPQTQPQTQPQAPATQSPKTTSAAKVPETKAPQQTQATTQAPSTTITEEIHEVDGRTYYVYYPENIKSSKKTYPVLSWANGTACQPSMYTGIFTELAKGGYIVIASSETMSADGSAQIEALDFVISLNSTSSSAAYKKVNTKQLGVIGHSQGGRSSVNAAAKDSRIKCVVSIAGSNYVEEAELNSTPTLFIAGGSDMIVSASQWIQPAYDAAKGPAVYASLNKAIHTTCCTNPEKYTSYILNWCNAWLKNDSSALKTFNSNGTLASDGNWSNFQCKGF